MVKDGLAPGPHLEALPSKVILLSQSNTDIPAPPRPPRHSKRKNTRALRNLHFNLRTSEVAISGCFDRAIKAGRRAEKEVPPASGSWVWSSRGEFLIDRRTSQPPPAAAAACAIVLESGCHGESFGQSVTCTSNVDEWSDADGVHVCFFKPCSCVKNEEIREESRSASEAPGNIFFKI